MKAVFTRKDLQAYWDRQPVESRENFRKDHGFDEAMPGPEMVATWWMRKHRPDMKPEDAWKLIQ